MFGWLKQWGPAARAEREQREVEQAMARTVAMARAIEARRAAENRAKDVAARARDAAWTHSWEQARASEEARHRHLRTVVQDMAAQRAGNRLRPTPPQMVPPPRLAKPVVKPADRSQASGGGTTTSAPGMGLDDGVPLLWPSSAPAAAPHVSGHGGGFDGGGASGDWSSPSSSDSSDSSDSSSSDSGSSDGGGSCGGGGD